MSGKPTRLSAMARTCLLRAARIELVRLTDERDRMHTITAPGASASVQAEIDCLQEAVAWLWRDH